MTGFFLFFPAAIKFLPADSDGWKNSVSHPTGRSLLIKAPFLAQCAMLCAIMSHYCVAYGKMDCVLHAAYQQHTSVLLLWHYLCFRILEFVFFIWQK
jgi:hypothetical protein